MKVIVPEKPVVDCNVRTCVKADGLGIEAADVKISVNPFDEIAGEEALPQGKAVAAREVIAVPVGTFVGSPSALASIDP
jgi:electron transfer flavoprotein beta subunit